MPKRTHSHRTRVWQLSIATVASGALVAACGAGSSHPTTAVTLTRTAASASSSATALNPSAASANPRRDFGSGPLAFSKCMRANGVSDFPDPAPGGGPGFNIPAGIDQYAPAFHAAQETCQKLIVGGDTPGNGAPPSEETLTKLRTIAKCMRRHGISRFPDPRPTRPVNPKLGKYTVITDFDGAFLLFPAAVNMEAPAYKQALTACGAPPLGLPH
jgi:hypothetical protein